MLNSATTKGRSGNIFQVGIKFLTRSLCLLYSDREVEQHKILVHSAHDVTAETCSSLEVYDAERFAAFKTVYDFYDVYRLYMGPALTAPLTFELFKPAIVFTEHIHSPTDHQRITYRHVMPNHLSFRRAHAIRTKLLIPACAEHGNHLTGLPEF
jgi:hypothetical protein